MKNSLYAGLYALLLILNGCNKQEVGSPSNLDVNLLIDYATGEVSVAPTADNAAYYTISWGDSPGSTPTKIEHGEGSHIYESAGYYAVTVKAYSSEDEFIAKDIVAPVYFILSDGFVSPDSYAGMQLIWEDDFNEISNLKWGFDTGDGCPNVCGWGNNELEYYQSDNASIVAGSLVIEAREEAKGEKNYTSARMLSKDLFEFQYGRVDVRALLPKGQGIWPAIWMLGANIDEVGWPNCGEVDIMEMIGGVGRENTVHGTVHWDNADQYASHTGEVSLPSSTFSDEFHVYSITWNANEIMWYVDNVSFMSIDITPAGLSEFRAQYFLLLNLAVGGYWPGNPDTSTTFPQRFVVDYVRVFQAE